MRKILVLSLVFAMSGCAHPAKFDSSKPVEIQRGFFGPPILQNGSPVNPVETMNAFEAVPEAESSVRTAKLLFWPTVLMAGAGGYFVGYGLGSGNKKNEIPIGAGLIAGSAVLSYFQRNAVADAAESYNRSLESRSKKKANFLPYLSPNPDGAIAGLVTSF